MTLREQFLALHEGCRIRHYELINFWQCLDHPNCWCSEGGEYTPGRREEER